MRSSFVTMASPKLPPLYGNDSGPDRRHLRAPAPRLGGYLRGLLDAYDGVYGLSADSAP